jgi:hypothetical protein
MELRQSLHVAARAKVPSFIRCVILLSLVRTLLRTRGFGPTLRVVRLCTARLRVGNQVCTPDGVAQRVAAAAAFFPGRARCLEQSLVLLYLLRRFGRDARLRMGVQPFGFKAHAWVECDGQAINERLETIRALVAFPEILT